MAAHGSIQDSTYTIKVKTEYYSPNDPPVPNSNPDKLVTICPDLVARQAFCEASKTLKSLTEQTSPADQPWIFSMENALKDILQKLVDYVVSKDTDVFAGFDDEAMFKVLSLAHGFEMEAVEADIFALILSKCQAYNTLATLWSVARKYSNGTAIKNIVGFIQDHVEDMVAKGFFKTITWEQVYTLINSFEKEKLLDPVCLAIVQWLKEDPAKNEHAVIIAKTLDWNRISNKFICQLIFMEPMFRLILSHSFENHIWHPPSSVKAAFMKFRNFQLKNLCAERNITPPIVIEDWVKSRANAHIAAWLKNQPTARMDKTHSKSRAHPLCRSPLGQPLNRQALNQPRYIPSLCQPLNRRALSQPLHRPSLCQPLQKGALRQSPSNSESRNSLCSQSSRKSIGEHESTSLPTHCPITIHDVNVQSINNPTFLLLGVTRNNSMAMQVYFPKAKTWAVPVDINLQHRCKFGCAYYNRHLFIIGGDRCNGKIYNNSFVLNVFNNKLKELAEFRFPRSKCGVAITGGLLYVLGGLNSERQAVRLAQKLRLADRLPSWTPIKSMKEKRTNPGVTVDAYGQVIVIGGHCCSCEYLAEGKWIAMRPLPEAYSIHGMFAVYSNEKVYAFRNRKPCEVCVFDMISQNLKIIPTNGQEPECIASLRCFRNELLVVTPEGQFYTFQLFKNLWGKMNLRSTELMRHFFVAIVDQQDVRPLEIENENNPS